jgi:predicted metal-dependent hydrolase
MGSIQIGQFVIPYDLQRSTVARERRITVTPNHVEVIALATDSDEDVASFLDRKRQWLFNTVREVKHVVANRHSVPRFITGSTIPYRGRNMFLTVRQTDAEHALVTYRSGFFVDLPHWTGPDPDHLVASELRYWLKQRARQDVSEIVSKFGNRFKLKPNSIRVAEIASGWGSCGIAGNISINWHLVFAPKRVLDYVVLHELAHLRYRSHGPEFWEFLSKLYPGYEEAKLWLAKYEGTLSADFLDLT